MYFNLDYSFPFLELMLLGLISLLLAQSARWISEICVNSSLFSSRFYICSEQDLGINENIMHQSSSSSSSFSSYFSQESNSGAFNQYGEVTVCCKVISAFTKNSFSINKLLVDPRLVNHFFCMRVLSNYTGSYFFEQMHRFLPQPFLWVVAPVPIWCRDDSCSVYLCGCGFSNEQGQSS